MKKFNKSSRNFKKTKLDIDEHKELALDLRKAQEILEPWVNRFYIAYSVNGKQVAELKKVLRLLSSTICSTQDNEFYNDCHTNEHDSPYYGSGKIAWI